MVVVQVCARAVDGTLDESLASGWDPTRDTRLTATLAASVTGASYLGSDHDHVARRVCWSFAVPAALLDADPQEPDLVAEDEDPRVRALAEPARSEVERVLREALRLAIEDVLGPGALAWTVRRVDDRPVLTALPAAPQKGVLPGVRCRYRRLKAWVRRGRSWQRADGRVPRQRVHRSLRDADR